MRILLAMSGGVDSSTVAHILKSEGHDVIAVRFTLWTDPLAPALASVLPSKCCTTQNIARAHGVCKELGIPLHVVDLQNAFKEQIVDPFLESYRDGKTPNPCILCNRLIKFGALLTLQKELKCDRLATGHYARVAREEMPNGTYRYVLLEAIDQTKDQSYYLYGLTQEQLSSVLFPLGGMRKSDVYALARKFGVPLPTHYVESQDLCFFPEKTPQEFLRRHLHDALVPGDIVRRDGTVVGSHDGIALYTIGQRRGLKIGGLKIPLEVVEKDATHHRLIVADQGSEKTSAVRINDLRWVSWKPEFNIELPMTCRTRSLMQKISGKLSVQGSNGIFYFDSPMPPQAIGQSLVLYRQEEVVGGGVIMEEVKS